jgi:hypothetical protein
MKKVSFAVQVLSNTVAAIYQERQVKQPSFAK